MSLKTLFSKFYSTCKSSNLSAVLKGIKDLQLEDRPMPKPKPNQVLLQMESVGICGSDVHFYVDGRIGPYVREKPMVTGHEAAGTVVEVGADVKTLQAGDRVALEPGVSCRICSYCKEGRYNLCSDMRFCANPPYDGNLSRFFAHDADFCFKLPDDLQLDEGALIEPLSVGVHSCKQGNVHFGDAVLVLGAGPIGLVTMMASKALGASYVAITDKMDYRLETAKKFGADCVFKMCDQVPEKELLEDLKKEMGVEPRVTIECTGSEQCLRMSLQATKTGGVVVLAGLDKTDVMMPLTSAIFREVDIRGVFRYNNDYPTAIEMVRTGKVKVLPLVTHHFKIEDTVKAFETAMERKGNPIKIIIHPNPNWKGCPKTK